MHENDLNPFGPFMLFCVSDWVPSLSVFVRQERDVIEEGEVRGHQQGAREDGRIGNDINSGRPIGSGGVVGLLRD